MVRISSPIENIKAHYTVVVVGSGYGGGIAASRLARAGQSVCILERGKEFLPGEYPDTEPEVLGEVQVDGPIMHTGSRTGLYDVRINADINVFLGCGLGGTSLVNANVSLPPERWVLEDPRWPQGVRNDIDTLLKDGFSRAAEMLKPMPYQNPSPPLAKLNALEKSATAMQASFLRTPINVNFKDGINHVGVQQNKCILCGDCVTGCNHAAKNTVLMNYLPDARNHGAEIYTHVSVRRLERKNGGWTVYYQVLDSGREAFDAPVMFLRADIVILAAGSLGSTEILLRSKAAGLPLSDKVGHNFTGNGDLLGFGYNCSEKINGVGFGNRPAAEREPVGPTITGIIDMRKGKKEDGIVIEEGAVPGGIGGFMPKGLALGAALEAQNANITNEMKKRELESLVEGPYEGAVKNTQTYLVMGHDDGLGKMVLKDDRLRIEWKDVAKQSVFQRSKDALTKATKPLGGMLLKTQSFGEINEGLTTVHPLGGCIMAESAQGGVVNHKGQVFSGTQDSTVYENLYVSDGAVVPTPLGVNPLLTISALAERCCALIAQDRGWQINYALPSVAPPPPAPLRLGVRFTETMKGYFSNKVKNDFKNGAAQGKKDNSSFQFILTITSDDLDTMLKDANHQSRMVGNVIAPALSAQPLTVTDGTFKLFSIDPQHVDTRNMIYRMKLSSQEGKTYFFHGFKVVHKDSGFDIWDDTTTLFITIYEGDTANGPVLGTGILKILPEDFMRQMTTIEITNAGNPQERMKAIDRFGKFFSGALFEIYGGVLAKPNAFGEEVTPRKKRALRLGPPEVHFVKTADGTQVRLTRYNGGTKGPLLLSPGFGTSTLAYTIDTVETNFPEYLFAKGFDLWLFDYRASPDLPSARTQFTLDDIATQDYPAAVRRVLDVTRAQSIQVMVHCVGSMTFLMAMMAGMKGVRSAVCSCLGFYPITPTENQVKAGLDLGSFLTVLGVKTMTTDFDENNWQDKFADAVLKLGARKDPCNSPVCRRILMMYGDVYKHDQLNTATHDAIHEMFGVANLKAFNHIALMVRKGQIVDKNGNDVYLPHLDRLNIPITFVHGVENHLFMLEGTKKTFQLLSQKNGPKNYVHLALNRYAHMDLFIGKNAAKDVFPQILVELEKKV